MEDCKHDFEEVYYGLKCKKCDLFYPDNGNYFAPDNEEEEYHSYDCTCENCLQNHPERDILYGDGEYFDWGDAAEHGVHWTLRLWAWLKNNLVLGLRQ